MIINDLILFIKKYGYANWRDYAMNDMEFNIQDRFDKELEERFKDKLEG